MPSILHARQPSPTTVYFFNAATPASSDNTATVVFTATLDYNTTHSTVLLLSEEASWLLWMWIAYVYIIQLFRFPANMFIAEYVIGYKAI